MLVQKLEPLQEEAFKVTKEITAVQGKVKQAVQESEEKLQTPITAQDAEEISTCGK
jgi:hypothetical protein